MATSNDHPGLPFIQAQGYTRGRPQGPALWNVVHDMEAGENSGRAESTAVYFANPPDGRDVSSHYCVDDNSVVQCVDLDDSAWTVGNIPGNYRGINWELAGFARQTRTEWLDAFGLAMFRQMVPIVQSDCRRFGIPFKRLTVAELRAFRPGFTSHNDLRLAFGITTHTDPGPNFPWDVFMSMMRGDDAPEGNEDMAIVYRAQMNPTDADDDQYWISDRVRRRGPVRTKSPFFGLATRGLDVVLLTEADRVAGGYTSWDSFLDAMAGPIDRGGATPADHRHTVSVTGSGSTGPAQPV